MAGRVSKKIQDRELINELLSLKGSEIKASLIYDLFGEFNGKARCYPYDLIDIPAGSYGPPNKKNKNKFTTTVGIWLFNKWFIEDDLFHIFGYMNKNIDGDVLDDINQELSFAIMEDRLTVKAMKDYLMKTQLIMQFTTVLCPSYNEAILTIGKVIGKKKDQLLKEHKAELEAGDTIVADAIEKELLSYALEVLGEDPSLDLFISKARGSINNNFKNIFIWKGVTRNPDPDAKNEFSVATSNYMDGIKAEEYALYCNSGIEGAYSRGKKTEDGGYLENLATAAYQDLVLDKEGTDCKTDRHIEVTLTKKNYIKFIYNNIIGSNGQLIELNSQNASKYIGKKVKMRMAYLCPHERPCNACAGNFYKKLSIKNVGLTMMQPFSILKNKNMKSFHDSTVKLTEMDPMAAFGLK